jgi:uncharacterized protein (DUF885 family)
MFALRILFHHGLSFCSENLFSVVGIYGDPRIRFGYLNKAI